MKLVISPSKYGEKDARKASKANKFIGFGCVGSSTERYRTGLPVDVVNTSEYVASDVVFVSINGDRPGRLGTGYMPILNQLALAKKAGVTFITDIPYDRNRAYNIGEREVAALLCAWGYIEVAPGTWRPR